MCTTTCANASPIAFHAVTPRPPPPYPPPHHTLSLCLCAAPLSPHAHALARTLALSQLKTGAGGFVLSTLATVVGFFDDGSDDKREKQRAPVRGDAGTGFRLFGSIFNLRSHATACVCVRAALCVSARNASVTAVGARGRSAIYMHACMHACMHAYCRGTSI